VSFRLILQSDKRNVVDNERGSRSNEQKRFKVDVDEETGAITAFSPVRYQALINPITQSSKSVVVVTVACSIVHR
jgi:hypothetical protein